MSNLGIVAEGAMIWDYISTTIYPETLLFNIHFLLTVKYPTSPRDGGQPASSFGVPEDP